MAAVVLSDDVIRLDQFTPADAAAHLAGEDEEMARRFDARARRGTLEQVQAAIAEWQADWHEQRPRRAFAVRLNTTGELVGGCEVRMRPDAHGAVSYWTFAAHRRRGLASRALRLLVS